MSILTNEIKGECIISMGLITPVRIQKVSEQDIDILETIIMFDKLKNFENLLTVEDGYYDFIISNNPINDYQLIFNISNTYFGFNLIYDIIEVDKKLRNQ